MRLVIIRVVRVSVCDMVFLSFWKVLMILKVLCGD